VGFSGAQAMNRIIVLSSYQDFHAIAVAEAIRRKGGDVELWLTSDFPTRMRESVYVDGAEVRMAISGSAIGEETPDVVWNRRPRFVLEPNILHPADLKFASAQCLQFREGFYQTFAPKAFWVNPYAAGELAELKIYQHRKATDMGLPMPTTLYSNDPAEIRSFLQARKGEVIYKPFRALPWRDDKTEWSAFTACVDESRLVDDDLLMSTPGIYQELIPKAFELRVTVIGEQIFATKLFSQDTKHGRLDWRYGQNDLHMESFELPPSVAASSQQLLRSLGLVFGCLDYIVTPDGRYVFLEVNQMGQWLFIEAGTDQPLLDAFTELLIQGRPDFSWYAVRPSIRLADVEAQVWKVCEDHARAHVKTPDLVYCEKVS